jgi:hypothetical protein
LPIELRGGSGIVLLGKIPCAPGSAVVNKASVKLAAISFAGTLLVGCSPGIVIRDAATGAPGEIASLGSQLASAEDGVLLIFVHGVGDHCPGYALDPKNGWLNQEAQTLLSIHPRTDTYTSVKLQDPAHWNNDPDPASTYTIARQLFDYKRDNKAYTLTAVELTWSGLTHWVKTKQLGYDLTETIPATDCEKAIPGEFDQKRVYVNRELKEPTLDRSLSDAVLYVGSYGTKINFAMGDALCRALVDDFAADACDWSEAQLESAKLRTVIFVTHSLGSRITYDTLLEMTGDQQTRAAAAFDHGSTPLQRSTVATNILKHNAATFMMANQLPLLGLTYVPPGYRSVDHDTPYLRNYSLPLEKQKFAFPAGATAIPLGTAPKEVLPELKCGGNPIACAALVHAREQPERPMEVVAFSDTNDLLTYAVSKPYATDVASESLQAMRFHFTNAFVHNSPRILDLLENPSQAHTFYFVNPDVRRVIICGGKDTQINSCK